MGEAHGDDMTQGAIGGLVSTGRLQPLAQVVIRGALCVGEHGSAWRSTEPSRQLHTAIFNCGYETLFAVPPTTGEEIWCARCRDWEACVVVGGSVVDCADCDHYQEHGHDRHRAVRQARAHSVGSRGTRATRHRARVGTHTREGIAWESYNGE